MAANVQLKRGGKVHAGYEGLRTPACGGNKSADGYRTVSAAVDCAKCLKLLADAAPVEVEAEPVKAEQYANVETTEGKFQVGEVVRYVGDHRPELSGELVEITRAVDHIEPNVWGGDRFTYVVIVPGIPASAVGVNERELATEPAEVEHDETECRDLDCSICFPPYVPQVGDRVEDDHTSKLGQIRTVVEIRGHLAEIKIEGPMFHAAHYGQEELNEDGTFTRLAIRKVETMPEIRTPSDCTTVQIGESRHARQFNAFWTICGLRAADAPVLDLSSPTCPDCCAIISEGREYAPKPGGDEPKRAKLRLSNASVRLNHRGELVIHADDALRGPVEISANEIDSRWLRACIMDMGPLSDD